MKAGYKFNVRLRELKKKKGLSCEDIACDVSVTRRTVQAWISGESQPKADKVPELAHSLGVTPNHLFCEDLKNDDVSTKAMELLGAMTKKDGEMMLAFLETWSKNAGRYG